MAAALAARYRVLLVDLDPQGNASTGLGIARGSSRRGSYAVLVQDAEIHNVARSCEVNGLLVVPADGDLAGAELEMIELSSREHRLRIALERAVAFDFVILDCPPSLGLLTLNGLVAAQSVLVPLQTE